MVSVLCKVVCFFSSRACKTRHLGFIIKILKHVQHFWEIWAWVYVLQVLNRFDRRLQSIHLQLKGKKLCIPTLFQKKYLTKPSEVLTVSQKTKRKQKSFSQSYMKMISDIFSFILYTEPSSTHSKICFCSLINICQFTCGHKQLMGQRPVREQ